MSDPFAPPRPYGPFAPPEDPFAADAGPGLPRYDPFAPPGPQLPRTPRSANGNISPTISIQIEGDPNGRIRDIETFSLTDDVQQIADPWSCEIPDTDGKFRYLLDYQWFKVTIWVSDPRVQDGREILWLKGVIVDVGQSGGEDGTTVRLAGYDYGWYLGSGAPIWKSLQGITFGALFRKLIRPENNWGITAAVSIYANSRLRQGRSDAEYAAAKKAVEADRRAQEAALPALQAAAQAAGLPVPTRAEMALQLTPPFFEKPPVIQTEPGEDCQTILIRYAKIVKRLIGMSAEGELQFFQPDYQQAPSFIFQNHRPGEPRSGALRRGRNNVLAGWNYEKSGGDLYNVVECVVTRLLKDGTGLANEANPNEGKDIGRYIDYRTAGPGSFLPGGKAGPLDPPTTQGGAPLRRLAFNDGEKWTLSQARERAKWKWQQGLYASRTLTYPMDGISQQGADGEWRLYCAGTIAEVHDSWNGVEQNMYVSRVQFTRNTTGTTSLITLKLPGLLGA